MHESSRITGSAMTLGREVFQIRDSIRSADKKCNERNEDRNYFNHGAQRDAFVESDHDGLELPSCEKSFTMVQTRLSLLFISAPQRMYPARYLRHLEHWVDQ